MDETVRILFLEDDLETAQAIRSGLEREQFEVHHAADVPSAVGLLGRYRFDAAILDLMVPGGSGFEVLEGIRALGVGTPVLLLTARDEVEDRVLGFERGADDYLVKPFAFVELLARLRALLRRPSQRVEVIKIGDLEIDPLMRRARTPERMVDLSTTEFALLYCLARHRGQILSRSVLLERVWGYRFHPGTNVVDVHVNRLRRKLEAASLDDFVRTVRGAGYVVG